MNQYDQFKKSQAAKILSVYGQANIEKSEENDLEKGGEGSKGGKVIGHTKSGKPIYDHAEHAGHKEFSSQDHTEAGYLHHTIAFEAKKAGDTKTQENHMKQFSLHVKAALPSKSSALSSDASEVMRSFDKDTLDEIKGDKDKIEEFVHDVFQHTDEDEYPTSRLKEIANEVHNHLNKA